MPRVSWRVESRRKGLNQWIFAVSLCSKLAKIGEAEVTSVCDSPRRQPWKHPGENPSLLRILPSCRSRRSSPSPLTTVHRRSRAHQSKFRWPKSSGACTIMLALLFRSWSTNSFHSIRIKSLKLKTICEFLECWCLGLPHQLFWLGQLPKWQLTWLGPTGQWLGVESV
jgi:hypothetical protein